MDMTYNNTSQQSSDLQKRTNALMDELMLNVILKELSKEQLEEFNRLLEEDKQEEAHMFISKYIPDLEDKLSQRIKEAFDKKVSN